MTIQTDYLTAPNLFLKGKKNKFAYREMGEKEGIPLVLLTHLSATLDNWDPLLINTLAENHWVIVFDNVGVGLSDGKVPKKIKEMADGALEFIHGLNIEQVDLLGLSMGGMIAQELVAKEPLLVRKLILVGTGPRGGEGISEVTKVTNKDFLRSILTRKDIKTYLFFTETENGRRKAAEFLERINTRSQVKDKNIRFSSYQNQLTAINRWGKEKPADLSTISQQTLIVNGDHDHMVPTVNSYDLAKRIPKSTLKIYPDAGHGSLFQFPIDFSQIVSEFIYAK
ncbi:alpha/beta fold hydrolase [Enterococcus mundtii]|uniref:Alpha/beta hydrolase n=1 Tax=Enterococcus mundtii TaxID=53346 RepID=A0A848MXV7_ENTMU|nr:alpha/beta hydrolase [Enterococcus mundtii]NMP59684.1 alpha/beta hydrolase [Enterococcus mundtii]